MKRLLAILLSVLMVISCFSTAVYAETTDEFTVTQEFCDDVNNYMADIVSQQGLFFYPGSIFTPENINSNYYITIHKVTEEAVIFQLRGDLPPGTLPEHREYDKIGDYTFCANYEFTKDNITGHCYYTNGTVYSIREAVEQNLVTLEELAVTIPKTSPTPEMVALLKLFKDNGFDLIVWANYLGNVNEYELYYVETSPFPEAMATVRVGNYVFETIYDYTHIRLYLKKGDTIYYLPDAYDDGLITDEDMDTVYSFISNGSPSWTVTKIELSREEKLLAEYVTKGGLESVGPENSYYVFRHLGEVQGYELYQFCCTYYEPWGWSYEFGKYKVDTSIGCASLFLIKDDTVLELQNAVDDSVITDFEALYSVLSANSFDVYHKSAATTEDFISAINSYLNNLDFDYSQLTSDNVYDCEWLEIYCEDTYNVVLGIKGENEITTKEMYDEYTFTSDTIFHYTNPCGYFLYANGKLITLRELKSWDEVAKYIPGATDEDLSNPYCRLKTYLEETNSLTKYNDDKAVIEKLGTVGDYYLYYAAGDLYYPAEHTEVIGDYSFVVNQLEMFSDNPLNLYLANENEVVPFNSQSYNDGKITYENVESAVSLIKSSDSDLFSDWTVSGGIIIDDPVGPYVTIASDRIKSGEKVKLLTVGNADNKEITFTSKTPEIAKVNQKGVVTALQKGMAEFEITVGEEKLTAKVNVTNNPKLEQKKVTVNKKGTVKIAIKGKVKNIKNVYTNTKIAKIKSKPNASTLKVKGLKKGKTTLRIKVNGVKTLKLKVVVK